MTLCPCLVLANNSYINSVGTVMSSDDYNNLLKVFSPTKLSVLSPEEYEQIMSYDINFDDIQSNVKYYEETYNTLYGFRTIRELTKEEYDSYEPQQTRQFIETQAKRISLHLTKVGYSNSAAWFTFSCSWKGAPIVRSFDDIGAVVYNLDIVEGTQIATQVYTLNGNTSEIRYSYNGTNTKYFDDGFGVSMNVINGDTLSALEMNINASAIIEDFPIKVYASYQHATSNITLATAQSYTLSSGGFGNVFFFLNGVGAYYDGMSGVDETIWS